MIVKLYLFICLFFLAGLKNDCFSQIKNQVFKEYIRFEKSKIDSLLNFETEKKQYKILSYIPNINYDIRTNSVNIGLSTNTLLNYYQTQKRNNIEYLKLKYQLESVLNEDIEKLQFEYEQLIDAFEILKIETQNTTTEKEIFNLKKEQYNNNKITLEEWLIIQNENQKKNLAILAKKKNLSSKMKRFQTKIKNNCFVMEIDILEK